MFKILFIAASLMFIGFATFAQSDKMDQEKLQIIQDFEKASQLNLSFQNGRFVQIAKPVSDKAALKSGFQYCQTDQESKGNWEILAAKDIVVDKQNYRAVLYTHQDKEFIALYWKDAHNLGGKPYSFRIFNTHYGNGR